MVRLTRDVGSQACASHGTDSRTSFSQGFDFFGGFCKRIFVWASFCICFCKCGNLVAGLRAPPELRPMIHSPDTSGLLALSRLVISRHCCCEMMQYSQPYTMFPLQSSGQTSLTSGLTGTSARPYSESPGFFPCLAQWLRTNGRSPS